MQFKVLLSKVIRMPPHSVERNFLSCHNNCSYSENKVHNEGQSLSKIDRMIKKYTRLQAENWFPFPGISLLCFSPAGGGQWPMVGGGHNLVEGLGNKWICWAAVELLLFLMVHLQGQQGREYHGCYTFILIGSTLRELWSLVSWSCGHQVHIDH